jgi:glycosyltransferase involved in cell wall biosynthesis
MPQPEISVVVPSFQGADQLSGLLAALRRQHTELSWELIVVLDGPDDDSDAVLEREGEGLPLRVVRFAENRGRPEALNAGFRAAGGRILVRCDDDLRPRPDYLERHAAWHEESTTTAVVGLQRDVFPPSAYADVYGREADRSWADAAYASDSSRWWRYWAGNCSVHRRMWEKVGAYDGRFRERAEDADWGYRLMRAGATFVLDRHLEVDHHYWGSTAARRFQHAFMTGEALALFESIHGISMDPSDPGGPRLWRAAVSVCAWPRRRESYRRLGQAVDVLLTRVPRVVGRRLIALGIESASVAGERRGERGAGGT